MQQSTTGSQKVDRPEKKPDVSRPRPAGTGTGASLFDRNHGKPAKGTMCLASCCCPRLCHWGPLIALTIIMWISLATVYSSSMWWPPYSSSSSSGWGGFLNIVGFVCLSSLTTFHFFCAMCDGPGFLPLQWRPDCPSDEKYLQFCQPCGGFKAPRSHHCRKCGRCVMKMDHHCPWINHCVGHLNHGHFLGFLLFAVLGCVQATYVLSMTLYYGVNRSWYLVHGTGDEPKVYFTLWSVLMVMFAWGLAIGVVIAVGALLYFQVRAVFRNQTGIEDWILEKAKYRRRESGESFSNPYNLGAWKNFQQVVTLSCLPPVDGVLDWPLAEGAHAYTLTVEQLNQKQDKRQRTREYRIVEAYSGSWFPLWSHGFRVACHPPITDEPRIPLSHGDVVHVTRWKTHWLYGEKSSATIRGPDHGDEAGFKRVRGWFPRRCAVEYIGNQDDFYSNDQNRGDEGLLGPDGDFGGSSSREAGRLHRNRRKLRPSPDSSKKLK